MTKGTVQSVEGKYAFVQIERKDMCGECHACEVIGEVKKCKLKCENLCESQVGDKVEIQVDENRFLKATVILYGVPLVVLVASVILGVKLGESISKQYGELIGVVISFLATGGTYYWIRQRDQKNKYDGFTPKIIRKIEEED